MVRISIIVIVLGDGLPPFSEFQASILPTSCILGKGENSSHSQVILAYMMMFCLIIRGSCCSKL